MLDLAGWLRTRGAELRVSNLGGGDTDIKAGLPATDNIQHWEPWRPLVVETARRVLEYTGGTRVMPMAVLAESY